MIDNDEMKSARAINRARTLRALSTILAIVVICFAFWLYGVYVGSAYERARRDLLATEKPAYAGKLQPPFDCMEKLK